MGAVDRKIVFAEKRRKYVIISVCIDTINLFFTFYFADIFLFHLLIYFLCLFVTGKMLLVL